MINKTSEQMSRQDLENLVAETSVDNIDTPVEAPFPAPLLNEEAFETLNAKPPVAKRPWLRVLLVSGIGFVAIFGIGSLFKGNMSVQQANLVDGQSEEEISPVSPEAEELARLRSENAALKRNMGIASQSLNQSELDALNADPEAVEAEVPTTQTESAPTSAVAARPTPPPARSAPTNTISYRAPAPRPPAPATTAPRPVRAPQSVATTARPPAEPVDPYALRERLSRLGTYGQPVAAANSGEQGFDSIVVSPKPSQSRPQLQQVDYRNSIRREIVAQSPEKPDQYYEDVAAVLGLPVAEVERPIAPEPAIAILPGEVFSAEIINGVSWNDGERPEIALETTGDLSIEDTVLIPSGTRMLATLVGIDDAGGASFDITQIFMADANVDIPPGSLIIQDDDGSMLRASRSGGQGSGGAQLNRAVWGSALNVLDNVIESDDSLIGDVAGGVGEAVLENQRDRVDADTQRRIAIERSQSQVWEIDPGNVQIFVSRYIPIGTYDEN